MGQAWIFRNWPSRIAYFVSGKDGVVIFFYHYEVLYIIALPIILRRAHFFDEQGDGYILVIFVSCL